MGRGGGHPLARRAWSVGLGCLWVAGLNGAGAAQDRPPRDTSSVDRLRVTETVYQGWRYFQIYCARCHGENARGSSLLNAPDLTYSVSPEGNVSADSFRVVVRRGSSNKDMKGFEDVLDDDRIAQLYAYVKERSDGRLAPGRPHRAAPPP